MNKSRSAQRRLAKADLVLLAVLLLFGVLAFFAVRMLTQKNGTDVQVLLHGEIYGTYPLSEEQKIPVHQNGTVTNTLQIADGTVKMIQADCPDELCVHQNAIAGQGETIVCLPNQVVVQILGTKEPGLDSISR